MKTKFLIGLMCTLVVAALSAVPALAVSAPVLLDKTGGTPLRSVLDLPKNQPDALEFTNEGPMILGTHGTKGETETVQCNEVELGTTVLANNQEVKKVKETKLAMPFGIAEGDNCIQNNGPIPMFVPTYFDTLPTGAVPATITVTGGPPFIATIHKLKLSQNKAGKFCTLTIEGVSGEFLNVTEGFVEEAPPNLNVTFGSAIPITCGTTKTEGFFIAKFFLETMSTTTDTAFITP